MKVEAEKNEQTVSANVETQGFGDVKIHENVVFFLETFQ